MLDTTHGYEATLRAESVARRKRLNVGRVPTPIQQTPARSVGILTQPQGYAGASGAETCGAPIEWISAQDVILPTPSRFRCDPVLTICRAAARHFKLGYEELISHRKHGILPRARQVAMYLSMKLTTRGWKDVARKIGSRDRTTVLHGYKRISALILIDPQLAADVEAVKALAIAADPGLGA